MKQRLLVMNGQKLVQTEQGGQWATDKVEKAGLLKPGIYHLYLATPADIAKTHDGIIIHVTREHLYQQVGKSVVKHDYSAFEAVPEVGRQCSITYDKGKAVSKASSVKLGRGLSR